LAPSVLLLHGGAFVVGNRNMKPIRFVAARLAQAGIGVCSVDYRLLFRGGGISQALEDVAQASAFWRQVAANYGCGPNISMMGLSAGSTLMLLHASATQERYASLVNVYGATDFSSVRGRRAPYIMRLVHGTRDRELWKARSPLYSAPIESPVLSLHGREDQMVPVEHSIRFHNDRVERGLASELALYDKAPHGWLCDATRAESEPSLARSARFILEHSDR
jgi:acetyl esterase/lipase